MESRAADCEIAQRRELQARVEAETQTVTKVERKRLPIRSLISTDIHYYCTEHQSLLCISCALLRCVCLCVCVVGEG